MKAGLMKQKGPSTERDVTMFEMLQAATAPRLASSVKKFL
jgi:hypothetical protein